MNKKKKTVRKRRFVPTKKRPYEDIDIKPVKNPNSLSPPKKKRGRPPGKIGPTGPIERTMVKELYKDFRMAICVKFGLDPKKEDSMGKALAKWMSQDKANADLFIQKFLPMLDKMIPPSRASYTNSELEAIRIQAEAMAKEAAQGSKGQAVNIIMATDAPPLPGARRDDQPIIEVDATEVEDDPPLLTAASESDEEEWQDDLEEFQQDEST